MGDGGRFGQPCRATAEEPASRSFLRSFQVIESHPVCLARLEERFPGLHAGRDALSQHVENPDVRLRDSHLFGSRQQRTDDLRLRDEEPALRRLEVMRQLHLGVGRIRAGEDGAGPHDGQDKDTVVDLDAHDQYSKPRSFASPWSLHH